MPPRHSDETRAAILADIQSGEQLSTRRIAARHGVSDRFVRTVAEENGITDAWSREHTESATRARLADLKERRALLAEGLLDDAEALRERAWNEYKHTMATSEGLRSVTLDLPPLAEVRNAYAAVGIAVDKHSVLLKMDTDSGAGAVRSLMAGIGDALTQAAAALDDEPLGTDEPAES